MNTEEIATYIEENYPDHLDDILLADGLENALLGIIEGPHHHPVACYDINKCIDIFIKDGLSHEEAIEHLNFNVLGSYMGRFTPVFLNSLLSQ